MSDHVSSSVSEPSGEPQSAGEADTRAAPEFAASANRRFTCTPGLERVLPADQRPAWLYAATLVVATVTGIVSNFSLSEARGIGLNLLVVMLVFFGGWFGIARRRNLPWWRLVSAAAAVIYAGLLALRASDILVTLNVFLMLGFGLLAASASYSRKIKGVLAAAVDYLQVLFNVSLGWIIYLTEFPWQKLYPAKKTAGTAYSVLTGVAVSLPFLLVFGLLFARAEVRFENFFGSFFSTIATLFFHDFWLTFFATVIALGLLRNSFMSASMTDDELPASKRRIAIGHIESTTVLTLLNALFLLFVVTQLPYLFGGKDRIAETPNLAWSEYARRGFFELTWVAALLIPTLMFFFSHTRTTGDRQVKTIRALGVMLSTLTGVVIVSTLQRMVLYTQAFGLTELRIYVSTFIVLLALVIALLNVFNCTGRSHWFVPSAIALGMVFSVGIQIPNTQALIARDIITRQLHGKQGDRDYLTQLSTDAVPAILNSGLAGDQKVDAVRTILTRQGLHSRPPLRMESPLSAVHAYERARDHGIVTK